MLKMQNIYNNNNIEKEILEKLFKIIFCEPWKDKEENSKIIKVKMK